MERYVIGAGGGKDSGGSSGAVEAPDSLRSTAIARILDLVCEGEIEGLVNGLESVFLDDTPLQNADGSMNFTGVTVTYVSGTQSQEHINGFPESESEHSVNAEVRQTIPLVRQIINTNVDYVRVTVSVPALYSQDMSTGNMNGTSVDLAIDLQAAGGAWTEMHTDTINGKTTSKYQRSYRIPTRQIGAAPWNLRVRRITADSNSAHLQNRLYWDSYTEIIEAKLRYPNSAIIGIEANAQQFSNIPKRGYDLKLLRLQVPTNYSPESRTYAGNWDGTFKTAWSDNPAWGFYRIATHPRYGLGRFIPDTLLDKWTLYQIGRYCDELVDDGFGGQEPRFTMNLYIQTREEAYKVLNDLASVFRGMAFYASGAISAVQDSPSDPVALYCPANVVDGRLVYQGTARKARHTVALVAWNDPSDMFRQKVEYVEDPEGVARYGINQTQITAIGCTSRGQAHRAGKWILVSERIETETAVFRVGLDGTYLRPGNVIRVIDPDRDGKRLSGRIRSATSTQITLDDPVALESGKTYDLYCMLPTGLLEHRRITNPTGSAQVLNLLTSFSTLPQTQSIWALLPSDMSPTLYRVMAITEPERHTLEITALVHYPEKYAMVEQGVAFNPPIPPDIPLPGFVDPPTNVIVTEIPDGFGHVELLISWTPSLNRWVNSYTCRIRKENENWVDLQVEGNCARLQNATLGIYRIDVTAINVLGISSQPATIIYEVIAMTAPPGDITGLELYGKGNLTEFDTRECRFAWNRVSLLDITGAAGDETEGAGSQPNFSWFRSYVVRIYGSDGQLRRTEYPVVESYNYTYERNYQDGNGVADRTFTITVTARDRWFRESQNPASLTVTNPPPRQLTSDEIFINAFAGAFTVDLRPISLPDLDSYVIHASQQASFVPSANTVISARGTHVYKQAAPGTWYIRVAAYDTFGQDALIYSDQYSCTVIDALVLPDELYSSLRTDFWVLNSIFYFNGTTLVWTQGAVARADVNYALAAGTLANAYNQYIIATLSGVTATLRMKNLNLGIPDDLQTNEVIIAITSAAPNTAGNYICYVRQANSMQMEGAIIRDATIVDAKITGTLSANRITTLNGAVSISGTGITLADINSTASAAQTNAQNAQNAASAAVAAADAAYIGAQNALSQLDDISNDDMLTPLEKSRVEQERQSILNEKTSLDNQADTYTVSRTAYDAAYTTLINYLGPLLADPSATTAITRATFLQNFTSYYSARFNLYSAIVTKARQIADDAATTAEWDGVTGIPVRYADPAPGGTGIFIGTSYMGYYANSQWKTYIRNDGTFYFSGSTPTQYIRWDGGSNDLLIRGRLTADDIQSGGTITGVTVTGSTLRTAASGQRIEASSTTNEFSFYLSTGQKVLTVGYRDTGSDYTFLSMGSIDGQFVAYDQLAFISMGAAGAVKGININLSQYYDSATQTTYTPGQAIMATSQGSICAEFHATYGTALWAVGYDRAIQATISHTASGEKCISSTAGASGQWCFYANTGGYAGTYGYGPFTGCHDALVRKGFEFKMGDIVVDLTIVHHASVSDTIAEIELSSKPKQKNVIGVILAAGAMSNEKMGEISGLNGADIDALVGIYDVAGLNALGEGQINVCREGGNIEAGDYICSSSTPGKGMRQDDDVLHNYTVAKAREAVTWGEGDNSVKQIACTYHCG